VQQLEQQEN